MDAIDIELKEIKSSGTAWYRLPKDMKDFLERCSEKDRIIGFSYDKGEWNFGVILGGKE